MTSDEIRRKYIEFFKASPRDHEEIDPAPLVLEGDPTTLFTSAGMQPLIPYLKGEPHPKGKRLVNSQPSFRTVDIDEIGDNRHLTFFEMLGNWSLGDYFKKDQLAWCLEFFTEELGLPKDKLWVSVFEGTKEIPKDTESADRWQELGIPEDRVFLYGVDKNWWSRSGTPESMPAGEIGGPDSEVFYEFDIPHDTKFGRQCHPNCECGRFIEIGNSVFIQYQKNEDGTLSELPQKNVDFGGGLERIAAAVDNRPDIFEIDIYKPVTNALSKQTGKDYLGNEDAFRIIADHLRASVAIASEGVYPSNKLQGYLLRRLIRRVVTKLRELKAGEAGGTVKSVVDELRGGKDAKGVIVEEIAKFERVLSEGRRLVEQNPKIDPFELFQSFGIPIEVSAQLFSEAGRKLSPAERKAFEEKLKEHQERSRSASAGMFKGGLADTSEEVTKLHTATHLLHAALRKVLGESVSQKGSNITAERLRFDFSHPQKLTEEEVKKVEDLLNKQIEKDLPVAFETKTLEQAIAEGALHFFGERYGRQVKVYTIGDPSTSPSATSSGSPFSKEICGGPHVTHTGAIGRVRIIKQEKLGSGIVRIYAKTENSKLKTNNSKP